MVDETKRADDPSRPPIERIRNLILSQYRIQASNQDFLKTLIIGNSLDFEVESEAGRDFIRDKQCPVPPAESLQFAHESLLGNEDTEVDADRLHDERGDVAPLQPTLDIHERLRVERRLDLAAVRQEVLASLPVLRVADA